jgi:transcriptional regulator with XRE-family HTH domain
MNIKGVIKERGYTIEQVAEKIGVTRVTLTQNLSRNPTINTLQRVADAIGCKVGEFFIDELSESDNAIICPKCGARFELKE